MKRVIHELKDVFHIILNMIFLSVLSILKYVFTCIGFKHTLLIFQS